MTADFVGYALVWLFGVMVGLTICLWLDSPWKGDDW